MIRRKWNNKLLISDRLSQLIQRKIHNLRIIKKYIKKQVLQMLTIKQPKLFSYKTIQYKNDLVKKLLVYKSA